MASNSKVYVEVKYNHLPALRNNLRAHVAIAIDKGLALMEQDAAADAPYRTGGLRASKFRMTPLHNGFDAAVAAMRRANPKAKPIEKPELQEGVFFIGFTADYAGYVHDGTHAIAGRPFLLQSIERHKEDMNNFIAEVLQNLAAGKASDVGSGAGVDTSGE